jgi:hypothetical protein
MSAFLDDSADQRYARAKLRRNYEIDRGPLGKIATTYRAATGREVDWARDNPIAAGPGGPSLTRVATGNYTCSNDNVAVDMPVIGAIDRDDATCLTPALIRARLDGDAGGDMGQPNRNFLQQILDEQNNPDFRRTIDLRAHAEESTQFEQEEPERTRIRLAREQAEAEALAADRPVVPDPQPLGGDPPAADASRRATAAELIVYTRLDFTLNQMILSTRRNSDHFDAEWMVDLDRNFRMNFEALRFEDIFQSNASTQLLHNFINEVTRDEQRGRPLANLQLILNAAQAFVEQERGVFLGLEIWFAFAQELRNAYAMISHLEWRPLEVAEPPQVTGGGRPRQPSQGYQGARRGGGGRPRQPSQGQGARDRRGGGASGGRPINNFGVNPNQQPSQGQGARDRRGGGASGGRPGRRDRSGRPPLLRPDALYTPGVVEVRGNGNCFFRSIDVCMMAGLPEADRGSPELFTRAADRNGGNHAELRARLCNRIGLRPNHPMRMTSETAAGNNYADMFYAQEIGNMLKAKINIIMWGPNPFYLMTITPMFCQGVIRYRADFNGGAWQQARLIDTYHNSTMATIRYIDGPNAGQIVDGVDVNDPLTVQGFDAGTYGEIVMHDEPTYTVIMVSSDPQSDFETNDEYRMRIVTGHHVGHFMAVIPQGGAQDPYVAGDGTFVGGESNLLAVRDAYQANN